MKIDELLDAFEKINPIYIEEAEKTRFAGKRRVKYWVPAAACAALLVLGGGVGIWRQSYGTAGQEEGAAETADAFDMAESAAERAGAADMEDGSQGEAGASDTAVYSMEEETDNVADALEDAAVTSDVAPSAEASETVWKVNEIEELQASVACGVAPARTEYYTAEELEAYYGICIIPQQLPDGYALEDAAEKKYGVGYNSDGNVMNDNCTLTFADSTTGGQLRISVRTVDMDQMIAFADTGLEPSVIGTTSVTVGHYRIESDGDGYLAIYEKDGVTVTVQGINMTEADFKSVLISLLA